MLIINLAISLFSVLKVNTLECLSLINRECMPRPKILNVNEGIGEALFTPAKIINLLDFKPEKLSIETENNKT